MTIPTINSIVMKGYTFSDAQIRHLTDQFSELGVMENIGVNLTLGSGKGYAGVIISIQHVNSSKYEPIVHIQSSPSEDSDVLFCAQSSESNELIGPSAAYASLEDVVRHTKIFIQTAVEIDRRQQIQETTSTQTNRTLRKVLNNDDIKLIESYSRLIGVAAHEIGWLHFAEGFTDGSVTFSLGYLSKGQPVPLGSIVASLSESGQILCSVRGVDKSSPLPGLKDYYPGISETLHAAWPYFEFMAMKTAQHNRRPWWKRIF